MALKDSWQQQQYLRRQDVDQRRQAVSSLLRELQQQRQIDAAQVRSDLSLFRQALGDDASDRRQKLQQYCESLQVQTQEFLAVAQAERGLIAQQLNYDLSVFRSTLEATVKLLRQDIQADIELLQTETQAVLSRSKQQRIENQLQVNRSLARFVEGLRSNVAVFLADAALERQESVISAAQKRQAELQQLFAEFAEFRSQLKHHRAELSRIIWGEDSQEAPQPITPQPAAKPMLVVKKPAAKSLSFKVAKTSGMTATAIEKPAPISDEQKIYDYVEVMQGARLTEIESALSLSRFQAVEGLRSLIQQGKITQRDRLYLISNPLKD